MKILVIGNYYYPEHLGGVEVVSHNLVHHYKHFGHNVRWVAADVPPNFRSIQDGDIPIKAWNFTEEKLGFPSPIPSLKVLSILFKNIKWCDVVHLQDCLYPVNILAFIILKILRKPVLITQYAKYIPYKKQFVRLLQAVAYATIGRAMFKTADHLVFITSNVRDGMKHINPASYYDVVPLGVDTEFFAPLSLSERDKFRERVSGNSTIPIILFVGRMVERKGIQLLEPLIKKHKDLHWVLIGRPDDYNPSSWNLPNLTYYQNVSEEFLRAVYASSDLLIHPSKGEGLTLIASECMACGTPIVISKESLYEVEEKFHNLFFPVTPETIEIENAISTALKNQNYLKNLRTTVREFAVKRLSWKKVSEEYLAILSNLTKNK